MSAPWKPALWRPLALAAALVAAGTLSPTAQAAPADQGAEVLAAIQRDLGLDADQARARLASDERAAATAHGLRKRLDTRFGGAWIDSSGTLTVGVTRPSDVDRGVRVKLVQRSEADLDAVKSALDANATKAPRSVPGWYVDLPTNTVVVKHSPASPPPHARSSRRPASPPRPCGTSPPPSRPDR
ncbi:S1 family peptidase [Saccharothrix hoggarensis]|uniref:Alpha-lytic protease prodomain-containing protein n=1 Tax=Saccharothrix hoggarensis TaxID=913853 RepID=A0ABW3R2Q7_9PSEU